ncbi:hypothetical protein LCGC14_2487860 [marine sediment metagenome]|uniref:Uncharacterized protein n=1 Tax=marine sediment metagenome TaxID=412755 RepID=A0A0F9DHL9_9ZZZZ
MGQILFGIIVLCILIYYPEVFLLAGLILAGFYFHSKYKLVEKVKTDGNKVEEEPTQQERAEKELESKLKQGYQDDPKWQENRDKVKAHTAVMREISDLEIKIEELNEALEKNPRCGADFDLAESKKRLKMLENQAGITHRRRERAKEEIKPVETPQNPPIDMTDQEIDAALQELND